MKSQWTDWVIALVVVVGLGSVAALESSEATAPAAQFVMR
jgi:hypothetical protein